MRKVWDVEDGETEKFEKCVTIPDFLIFTVMIDTVSSNLPHQRSFRVLLTRFAWRKRGLTHDRMDAVRPACRSRGEAALVGQKNPQLFYRAVFEIVREFYVVGEQHLAGRFEKLDIARCTDRIGFFVVADGIGEEDAAALCDFDVAARNGNAQVFVAGNFIGP